MKTLTTTAEAIVAKEKGEYFFRQYSALKEALQAITSENKRSHSINGLIHGFRRFNGFGRRAMDTRLYERRKMMVSYAYQETYGTWKEADYMTCSEKQHIDNIPVKTIISLDLHFYR
ncbi:hypothetical protein [Pseudomonas phage UF_RH7]|nr:hypothetical protein [Pseudomonas phage UF_RH7]